MLYTRYTYLPNTTQDGGTREHICTSRRGGAGSLFTSSGASLESYPVLERLRELFGLSQMM